MKKLCCTLLVLLASAGLWAQNNVITYKATTKLQGTTDKSPNTGVHWSAFNVDTISHVFNAKDSIGTITFTGDVTSIGTDAFRSCYQMISISLPATLKTIGLRAFYSCSGLKSIAVPASVTSIGYCAFCQCTKIKSFYVEEGNTKYCSENGVLYNHTKTTLIQYPQNADSLEFTIPSTVTSIGDYAFYYAYKLTNIKCSSATSIGNYAFYLCAALSTFQFPSSLKTIGNNAFQSCSKLTNVQLPSSVTKIGDYAFSSCSFLADINIPAATTSIGIGAFSRCTNLQTIDIEEGNTKYAMDNGALLSKDKKTLKLYLPQNPQTQYVVPESVTGIDSEAFYACKNLTSVTLPPNIKRINQSTFYGCSGLISMVIPNTVDSIEKSAFYGCTNLQSISLPTSITTIPESALGLCSSLTSVTIPQGVKGINKSAFSGCTQLTTVELPEGLTYIGQSVFSSCNKLSSIHLPNSLSRIGNMAFSYCMGLVSLAIPESIDSIGQNAFFNVNNIVYHGTYTTNCPWGAKSINGYIDGYLVYEDETKTKIVGCSAAAVGTIAIPLSVKTISNSAFSECVNIQTIVLGDSVTTIGESAFEDCVSLQSINLPNSVKSIGMNAFVYCAKLDSVILPPQLKRMEEGMFFYCDSLRYVHIGDSVTFIGMESFEGCYSLKSITLPASLSKIGDWVFADCVNLDSITCKAVTPPICGDDCFLNVPLTAKVLMPQGTAHRYAQAHGWNYFSYPIDFLQDNIDNDSLLSAWLGETMDVKINRTFFRDGENNTICLPFSLDAAALDTCPLANFSKLQQFVGATIIEPGSIYETLELTMEDASCIEAGYPYIIAWEPDQQNIVNPSFGNVTITAANAVPVGDDKVTFCGTFSPYMVQQGDKGTLFVGKKGQLNWPKIGGNIRGFRCFFAADLTAESPIRRGMSAWLTNSKSVSTENADMFTDANKIQKLIDQGKVVIVHDGVRYNLNGQKL